MIAKHNKISNEVCDLYYSCSDPECGHTFVSTLSFKHTLSPSRSDSKSLALSILKGLPECERNLS
ncbi:ogr/Delta-like zinc finger family protein [Agarilytica rhodophyticola]|uniref:ogr/Delta-like zinc finger family protein n=1 Tax=Agarilytica rhodophyticola TaxID=1737490 RepID=UPI000B349B89|nr:ogr/Delta-like zinc finger family protein [Agarilytica rhodophyticola]